MSNVPTIGICCIGSGVGQSVIRSLRLSRLSLRTIGFGNSPYAFGAYECDARVHTRSIYDEGYVDDLIGSCRSQRVDLLIPGLDDELAVLARRRRDFESAGVQIVLADDPLVAICRDKDRVRRDLAAVAGLFVRSYDPRNLQQELASGAARFPLIAKPRGGSASRGVRILMDASDLERIPHHYVVQELAVPHRQDPNYAGFFEQLRRGAVPQVSEISIQLVHGRSGTFLGRMATHNRLQNGIPVEVLPIEDARVWAAVDRLVPSLVTLGLRGPLNLQGRLTDEGLKIFEMNPRFTGITGLRALLGFNEVEACVRDWLGIGTGSELLHIRQGRFGIRQVTDKAISIAQEPRVASFCGQPGQKAALPTRRVFVTGASGYVGRNWIRALARTGCYEIWAYSRVRSRLSGLFDHAAVVPVGDEDLRNGRVPMGALDAVVHLGSARPHNAPADFAESLRFTADLFAWAASFQVPMILNASSQSVYGSRTEPPWKETTVPQPETLYGHLKLATELLLETACRPHRHVGFSSIRIGAVAGGADGLLGIDLVSQMVRRALAGEDLQVTNAALQVQRIDIRDLLDGLTVLLERRPQDLRPVYNLGSETIVPLVEVAGRIAALVAEETGRPRVAVTVSGSHPNVVPIGLDSGLLQQDTGWRAMRSIDKSIESVITHYRELRLR